MSQAATFYQLTTDEWCKAWEILRPAEIKVLYYLRTLHPFGGELKFKIEEMAEILHLNRSTISRALSKLNKQGWIQVREISLKFVNSLPQRSESKGTQLPESEPIQLPESKPMQFPNLEEMKLTKSRTMESEPIESPKSKCSPKEECDSQERDAIAQSSNVTRQSYDVTRQSHDVTKRSHDVTARSHDVTKRSQPKAETPTPQGFHKPLDLIDLKDQKTGGGVKKFSIPRDLQAKLEELTILNGTSKDAGVLKAIASVDISQAWGAANHVEKSFDSCLDPRSVFLYQLRQQPVEKMGPVSKVITAADFNFSLEILKKMYPKNWEEAALAYGHSYEAIQSYQ